MFDKRFNVPSALAKVRHYHKTLEGFNSVEATVVALEFLNVRYGV